MIMKMELLHRTITHSMKHPPWNGYGTPPSDDYENGAAPPYDYPHYGYPPWNGYGTPPS